MRILFSGLLVGIGMLFVQCGNRQIAEKEIQYIIQQDSLTDHFLVLQDSLVQSWNWIIANDNKKIKGMENLLEELSSNNAVTEDEWNSFHEKIQQLKRMRFSLKTLHNKHTVTEYDAATEMLMDQLFSFAESKPRFVQSSTFYTISEDIVEAESRAIELRAHYDTVASIYNLFVNNHRVYLESQNLSNDLSEKTLFGF
jgi:hypothetical protein